MESTRFAMLLHIDSMHKAHRKYCVSCLKCNQVYTLYYAGITCYSKNYSKKHLTSLILVLVIIFPFCIVIIWFINEGWKSKTYSCQNTEFSGEAIFGI